MQVAPRFTVDAALYAKLTIEIGNLASAFPKGIAVRLHALGDFANLTYARFWLDAVRAVGRLHLFGFTAHDRTSEIGATLEEASQNWDRLRMRFSGGEGGELRSCWIRPHGGGMRRASRVQRTRPILRLAAVRAACA